MNDTPHSSRVGTRLGPYQLTRLIGRGGMGEVFEAEDTAKGRVVALKLLPEALSGDVVFRERLQREARAAGRLQEPHVVPIHDYGEIDGQLFVDMRLIDGIDLRTVISRSSPMPPSRAVGIIRDIASALDAAHAAGVLHRDVKPENILITPDDFAYLVDFGIASAASEKTLTETGTTIGTYAYMAPERFSTEQVTAQADVYALACVLYQCLTGTQPFDAKSITMLITAHLMQAPPRPSEIQPGIPPAFDAIIAKGMAKRAEDRFASAGELARTASAAAGMADFSQSGSGSGGYPAHEPTIASSAIPPYLPPPSGATTTVTPQPTGRRRLWLIVGALAAVLLIVAGTVGWVVLRRPSDETLDGSTVTITRTVESTTRPPVSGSAALNPDERKLLGMITNPTTCKLNTDQSAALAAFNCWAPGSDGHRTAYYALYDNPEQLEADFNDLLADDEQTNCPNAEVTPTTWDYEGTTDDKPEGSLACGAFQGSADILWTKTSDLMLGTAQGPDMGKLYDWWVSVT
jgi:serine/threonine kinase PknH